MFPILRDAVAKLIDPTTIKHVGWSHFESDECGALNNWLELAPRAQPFCTLVGKLVNVDDFSLRPVRGMTADDALTTGKYRFKIARSPHLPHGWDAGVLFEETRKSLFCSDLFHHFGDVAPITTGDLIEPSRAAERPGPRHQRGVRKIMNVGFRRCHLRQVRAGLPLYAVQVATCMNLKAQWERLGGGMARVREYDSREHGLEYILKCLNVTNGGANLYEVTKFSHSADEVMLSNSIWDPANLNRVSETHVTV